MFKNRSGIMGLSLEDIDGVETVEATDTGVDAAAVIEAGEGAEEVENLDTQVTEITTAIEDALGVVEGADAVVEQNETALASAEEVTADVVQASQESLAQARAIMGMDKSSNIGFEAIIANPRQALKLSNEDWKETAKLIYEKAKEFFRNLLQLMKKGYVAIMKMTASDISTVDALYKKVEKSNVLEASKEDTMYIFKSTTTKVRNKLGAALAVVGVNNLSGANFKLGITKVIDLVNNKGLVTTIPNELGAFFGSGNFVSGSAPILTAKNISGNTADNIKANFGSTDKLTKAVIAVNFSGTKVRVMDDSTESYTYVAKEAFVNSIDVSNVNKGDLLATLKVLRKALVGNKEFFDAGSKAISTCETALDKFVKDNKESETAGKDKLALKISQRVAKGVVYDSILNKIKTDKAVLSVISTLAFGKADKEKTEEK